MLQASVWKKKMSRNKGKPTSQVAIVLCETTEIQMNIYEMYNKAKYSTLIAIVLCQLAVLLAAEHWHSPNKLDA